MPTSKERAVRIWVVGYRVRKDNKSIEVAVVFDDHGDAKSFLKHVHNKDGGEIVSVDIWEL